MTQFSNFTFKNVICFLKNMLIRIKVSFFFFGNIFRCSLDGVYAFLGGLVIIPKRSSRVRVPNFLLAVSMITGIFFFKNGSLVLFDKIFQLRGNVIIGYIAQVVSSYQVFEFNLQEQEKQ